MLLLNFDDDALVTTMCAAKITVNQRFTDCVPAFCYGELLRRDEVFAKTFSDRLIALFIQINDMGFDPVKCNSVIDALLRYYVNGGGFKHVMDGELDGMATEQAYYALTAYYRFLTGKTNLYDMTDTINKGGDPVEVEPTVPATTEPAEVEPAKTNFPWWILVICVVGGCGLGMVIAIVIIPKFKKKD